MQLNSKTTPTLDAILLGPGGTHADNGRPQDGWLMVEFDGRQAIANFNSPEPGAPLAQKVAHTAIMAHVSAVEAAKRRRGFAPPAPGKALRASKGWVLSESAAGYRLRPSASPGNMIEIVDVTASVTDDLGPAIRSFKALGLTAEQTLERLTAEGVTDAEEAVIAEYAE